MTENTATDPAAAFPLRQLYFYLTQGCNLACKHCWLAPEFDPDGSRNPVLPLPLFRQALEEALPLGLNRVKLTGGEPLLHPDFSAMLDIIREKDLEFTLETNGILMTPEITRALSRQKNPSISVSLDGAAAETHDKIRGVRGAFAKATDAVRSLSQNSLNPQIIMSIMPENVDQVEAIIALAEELGAASVKFNIIQPTGRGKLLQGVTQSPGIEELIALGKKVGTDLSQKTRLQLYFDTPAAFLSLSQFNSGNGCGTCSINTILGVLPTGEYALCGIGYHVPELTFGRVGQDRLTDVWQNNPVLHELRSGLPDRLTGICSRCLMKHYCLGSCIAQNYYRSLSLWAPFWFCEQAEDAGLFPASRLNLTSSNEE